MKNAVWMIPLALVLIVFMSSAFVVQETEQAIVVELGKPVRSVQDAGLHFKVPFLQQVTLFEKRLLQYDSDPKELLTADKQQIVVDNYARWKIVDPLLFYQSVRTVNGALSRLDDIIYSSLREILGRHSLKDLISVKRAELTELTRSISDEKSQSLGIEIVDVRIKRADLPEKNERNVFARMITERQRLAKKFRAEGEEEAQKIRSEAEKEARILRANAKKESDVIRGEGDAQSTKIFSRAYNADPEFYKFQRQLEAYKKVFKSNTSVVMTPDMDLLEALQKGR